MIELNPGHILQSGKYRIVKTLGQGGFGITYLANSCQNSEQVCIKEFFMKSYCDRDDQTSQVRIGTRSNYELVNNYKNKFIKETQMISRLDHPNIIKIVDVFEENETAYYVMDYIEGDNLNDIVKRYGALSEAKAIEYIKTIGEGLSYIHDKKMNHLDVKPGNIMVKRDGDIPVLIDFGMSKQYDEYGEQTSTTPVGVSAGYAPTEMYTPSGVSGFSPQTDIYELGATLYRLVVGEVPPTALEIVNEGFPTIPERISKQIREAIEKAMSRKKDRPSTIEEFISLLPATSIPKDRVNTDSTILIDNKKDDKSEETTIIDKGNTGETTILAGNNVSDKTTILINPVTAKVENGKTGNTKEEVAPKAERSKKSFKLLFGAIAAVLLVGIGAMFIKPSSTTTEGGNGVSQEFVDLGLSVKWSSCNLGTTKPEGYGNYYAWGETQTKKSFSDDTYTFNDNPTTLPATANGAKKRFGGNYSIPTVSEFEELANKDNCTWTWTNLNGVKGYKVQSKKKGFTDKWIFLPAAGIKNEDQSEYRGTDGCYWTIEIDRSNNDFAKYMDFNNEKMDILSNNRFFGLSIRPVMK